MNIGGEGPIWLVGAGNMGGAMLRGWLDAGIDPARITVIRPSGKPIAEGVRVLPAPPPDGEEPAVLVLAVKPQKLDDVAPGLVPMVGEGTLIVSVLAGAEIASLTKRFPDHRAIVRVMPNTPVAIGKGVLLLHTNAADDSARAEAEALSRPLGMVEWIEDEALFGVATAVSGCGPAFLFRFIDALAKAGEEAGLPADQAARLALGTVEGSALLAAGSEESPARLADRVASPGGSTRAGLDVLDENEALDRLLAETVRASVRRNAEMAAEAARGGKA
ncbi:MAG TPA: pyrroline-5-carboxylate reductase [Sphingomonas sp.]|nr:pyrroline-5-carboxylate reductase [Sphingomonas sp.]